MLTRRRQPLELEDLLGTDAWARDYVRAIALNTLIWALSLQLQLLFLS